MTGDRLRADTAFVVFGDDWRRHVSSMQHVFSRVALSRTVIWFNSLGNREPTLRDLGRAAAKFRAMFRAVAAPPPAAVHQPGVPAEIISPRVLPWHGHPLVAALNRASLTRDIRAAVRRATGVKDFVLVTGLAPAAKIVGEAGELASIYFCMDDFLVLPGTSPRMIAPLEAELLRRVDAVVATAQRLVDVKRAASNRGYHLPQGVNYEHFSQPRPVPVELASLPRPIIGFAGGIGLAVDAETINAIAAANPGASVVLVGPLTLERSAFTAPNIRIIAAQPYELLPAYVQAFDVGLIPYIESDWTRAVDPLKLLEYLAAGVPVVATPLPEVRKYADAVGIAELGTPFVDAVRRALTGTQGLRGDAARRFARGHSWEQRAQRFLQIVDEVLAARSSRRGAH